MKNLPALNLMLVVVVATMVVTIAGCDGTERDERDEPALLQPHTEALEKARGVEDEVLEAARRQREKIDEQGNL